MKYLHRVNKYVLRKQKHYSEIHNYRALLENIKFLRSSHEVICGLIQQCNDLCLKSGVISEHDLMDCTDDIHRYHDENNIEFLLSEIPEALGESQKIIKKMLHIRTADDF